MVTVYITIITLELIGIWHITMYTTLTRFDIYRLLSIG